MADAKEDPCWIGFDLGGTKMLATVFDSQFRKLGSKRKRTKGHEGEKAGMARMFQTIQQALESADVERERIAGLGVGCPGPVNLRKGVVVEAANLGWRNVPMKRELEKEFGWHTEILNDVDAGVYAEARFGAARKAQTVVGIFPGTGVGGGCVYGGEILSGAGISCMEIGHIQVRRAGHRCGCGRYGCLETEASRLAIAAEVAKAAYRGEAPFVMDAAGTDLAEIRSGILAQALEQGDEAVREILERAAKLIGVAVASVVHLIAPDLLLLGGGLVEAMPKFFVEHVRDSARARVMPAYADTFNVVAAELGDDAAVLGAAAWAEHRHNR